MKSEVVVSGMRPTGRLHLGNYWGALRNWIELTGKYQCYFFVADWHMLTTGYDDTSKLQDNIREMVLDWLAAGLDPAKCVIFKQSDVPEHAELALVLSMITPLSWLENNPTWKEQLQEMAKTKESRLREALAQDPEGGKLVRDVLEESFAAWTAFGQNPGDRLAGLIKAHPELSATDLNNLIRLIRNDVRDSGGVFSEAANDKLKAIEQKEGLRLVKSDLFMGVYGEMKARSSIRTHGFLGYPVLQAADVLLYKGTKVPVGQDQLPHLELSREIARKFNSIFGEVLTEPRPIVTETPKLPGNDGRKMSKSFGNTIELNESLESLSKKVMGMYTDPKKLRKDTPGHPDPGPENPPGCVVYALHKVYTPGFEMIGEDCRAGRLGCVHDKRELLLPNLEKSFSAFRGSRKRYESDPKLVQSILDEGGRKARAIAQKTMAEVRRAMRLA